MGWCHPFFGSPCARGVPWVGRRAAKWKLFWLEFPPCFSLIARGALRLCRGRAACTEVGAPLISFSRSDQPFTIPGPPRKQPSHPRRRQKSGGGMWWRWVGWSEPWAVCTRSCSQQWLNAIAVIRGSFCSPQHSTWSKTEKCSASCPNPLNMVSVHSYPLAVLQ